MAALPEITVVDTLVTDPELHVTPNNRAGDAVATFTVAANDRYYDPDTGQWIETGPTFLPCSIWHQTAANIAEPLSNDHTVQLWNVPTRLTPHH
jgi:single-strand DNA-binding protein